MMTSRASQELFEKLAIKLAHGRAILMFLSARILVSYTWVMCFSPIRNRQINIKYYSNKATTIRG